MNDDRIIAYLRSRGRLQPAPDLVARVMAAVDAAPLARSAFAVFLPAAAIAGAVALVIALAIVLGQRPNVGPDPSDATVPAPSPASVDELQRALESAVATLREAPGVEGISTSHVLGELSSATWFLWRPDGDQIVISLSDVDVAETGWWLEPGGEPRARQENVTTTIHVLLGEEYLVADDVEWRVHARAEAPQILSIVTGILDGDPLAAEAFQRDLSGEVVVTRDPRGAATWVLTAPDRDGTATSEWRISAEGHLESWSFELVGVTPTPDDATFITEHRTEFRVLTRVPGWNRPDIDEPPDVAALGLPRDFPLGPGNADR